VSGEFCNNNKSIHEVQSLKLCVAFGKKKTKSGEFCNNNKSIHEVQSLKLCVAFGNKLSFVSVNGSINMTFNLVNPLAIDNYFAWQKSSKDLGVIIIQGIELFCHDFYPLRMLGGFSVVPRLNVGSER